jgi:hypothetical protein
MSLTFHSTAVSAAFGTVSFFLADEGKTIRVDVSQDVLDGLGEPRPTTKHAYMQRLMDHRRQFTLIAASKYAGGHFRQEVRVLVVDITGSDLL